MHLSFLVYVLIVKTNNMEVEEIYDRIIKLNDLSPSEKVNFLFTQLVNKATDWNTKYDLRDSEIDKLQKICSASEFELEKYWAKRIINSDDPQKELQNFPYTKNYKDLSRLKWFSIKGCSEHLIHKILFIGGGPLPMTSIVLANDFGLSSTILDIDKTAAELSTCLIEKLNLQDKIKIINSSGETFDKYSDYNIIFVAALAGSDEKDKEKIFDQINNQAKDHIHVLARSSWANRTLLYKPLSESIFKKFKPIIQINPFNDIVNSIVIFSN